MRLCTVAVVTVRVRQTVGRSAGTEREGRRKLLIRLKAAAKHGTERAGDEERGEEEKHR